MAAAKRVELLTPGFGDQCSARLSYTTIKRIGAAGPTDRVGGECSIQLSYCGKVEEAARFELARRIATTICFRGSAIQPGSGTLP